jgi:hypothetical protein
LNIATKARQLTDLSLIYHGAVTNYDDIKCLAQMDYQGVQFASTLHFSKLDLITTKLNYDGILISM